MQLMQDDADERTLDEIKENLDVAELTLNEIKENLVLVCIELLLCHNVLPLLHLLLCFT